MHAFLYIKFVRRIACHLTKDSDQTLICSDVFTCVFFFTLTMANVMATVLHWTDH